MRAFRFGVQLDAHRPKKEWVALCREVEHLGYGIVTLPDHIGQSGGIFAAWTAAAEATQRLRLGTLVLNNDLRHPVVLAAEVATADVMTDGRVELGIGAGWMDSDYRATGIVKDRAGIRIDRLQESIGLIRAGWQNCPVKFSGRYYNAESDRPWPQPVQSPLPILVGGGGRRVLSLAGALADIVSVNRNLRSGTGAPVSADVVDEQGMFEKDLDLKLGWVRSAAHGRPVAPELHTFILGAEVSSDRRGAAERVAAAHGIRASDVLASPHFLVGTPAQMIEDLRLRRTRFGFTYLTVREASFRDLEPVIGELAGT